MPIKGLTEFLPIQFLQPDEIIFHVQLKSSLAQPPPLPGHEPEHSAICCSTGETVECLLNGMGRPG